MKNSIKISTMFIMMVMAMTAFTSCNKKQDDPKPIVITPTQKLEFKTTTAQLAGGNGQGVTLDLITMVESDSAFSIVSVTGASSNVLISNISGTTAKITPTSKVYAGTEVVTVTLKRGSLQISKTVTVYIGSTAAAKTYSMLTNWFNTKLTGDVGNFYIKSDGSISSDKDGSFYNDSNSQFASYTIQDNGYIRINVKNMNSLYITYSIEEVTATTGKQLLFTDVVAVPTENYSFWK